MANGLDGRFKDTAVMMLETGTKNQEPKRYRMEAEIDCTFETIPSEYQIGSVRLFFDNRTDKRIEVTTVNIERCVPIEFPSAKLLC